MSDMLGGDVTYNNDVFARAPDPPLFMVISTKAFPGTVFNGISNTIWLALIIEQNADAIALTVAWQE